MKLLIDASALVPLVVERDQWYANIQRILATVRPQRPVLCTTNWTLYDALVISQRFGHARAEALFRLVSTQFHLVPVSPDIEIEALRRFLRYGDKTASVVDHANVLTAVGERCAAVV